MAEALGKGWGAGRLRADDPKVGEWGRWRIRETGSSGAGEPGSWGDGDPVIWGTVKQTVGEPWS